MTRPGRACLAALLLAASLGLGACEPGDALDKLSDLIPSSKKPLPGDRKEVFPQGVPGVAQGVPPELMKGYQAPPDAAAAVPAPGMASTATTGGQAAATDTAQKPKPKKKVARVKPPAEPSEGQAPQPAQPAPAAWPAPQGQAATPWPSQQAAPQPWPTSQRQAQ